MSKKESDNQKTSYTAVDSIQEQLRFTDEQFIWRFSPNQTDPELLEAIFVGREPLLQNVLEKIADSVSNGSAHHVLLFGPRGIGKSHFASLLHHRLLHDPKLSERLNLARLNEDETTTSLVQLLVRIYRALCKDYPDQYSADWLDELLNQPREEIAEALTRRLIAHSEKRTLVILVENLSLLFEDLGLDGQQELRALLQEHPFGCVIATSQQLSKAVSDRSEPFFGFFQQIPLMPLSLQDAQQLLLKIARTKEQDDLVAFLNTPDGRGRIRAIHDLAGGNHRVYIVLSGFATRESLDQLVAPFQKMADDLTPYYQERLRWISPMQRQIVELLCREHGTVNPKEMARRLMVDQRTIGKQVRLLAEIGYLTATKRGRETFYELSEPLMRLAYEVKEQSLLEMLIEFLRIWYRPDQMKQLRSANLNRSTKAYVDAALERSQTHPDPRLKLLQAELEKAEAEGRSHELATLWEEKAAASHTGFDWFQAGYYFDEINKNYSTAVNCYEKAIELDPMHDNAWNNKGSSLHRLGRYEKALSCFDKAIEIDADYANAWNNKGSSLQDLNRYAEALSCYNKAIELEPKNEFPSFNRSEALFAMHRWKEGFDAIRDAFIHSGSRTKYLGDVGSMLSLIFRLSEDDVSLQSRVSTLVDIYQQTAGERGFPQLSQGAKRRHSSQSNAEIETQPKTLNSPVNPLSYVADSLVKSLAKIDAERVTPNVMESYVRAIENRVAGMPEFEISLRLFRYGIRYLISGDKSEFVPLIQPERRILYQVFGLAPEV